MSSPFMHPLRSPDTYHGRRERGRESHPLRVVEIQDLIAMELPAREEILSPWLATQSLNMIYAWRGVGKTHVALGVAYAIACGDIFLNWHAKVPRKVLYIDGEMPAAALQERLAAISASSLLEPPQGYLSIITPDLQKSLMPDLATPEGQGDINEIIRDTEAEVIIVDNLSCLVRGNGRENEAESWLPVAEWALSMRAQGKTILFIHHAAKGGQQRGTSKREDLLDTVICLKRPSDYCPTDGAVFEIHFEKARHLSGDATQPIKAKLTQNSEGLQLWTWQALEQSTFEKVVELANEGLSQREITDELEVNKSTVSRAWRKGEEQGLIKKAMRRGGQ